MDTIVGVAAGILVVLFGLWLGKRRADRMIPRELAEAMRLEKSDPAKSAFLADSYFMREAARDENERAQLWDRAPNDLAAAEELRRRLLQDLETDAHAQKELGNSAKSELLRTLEESRRTARDQIGRLDAMILRLGDK